MNHPTQEFPTRKALRAQERPRFAAIMGVTGEIMITLGLLTGFFWVWFVVLNDVVAGAEQNSAGADLAQSFQQEAGTESFGKVWGSSQVERSTVGSL